MEPLRSYSPQGRMWRCHRLGELHSFGNSSKTRTKGHLTSISKLEKPWRLPTMTVAQGKVSMKTWAVMSKRTSGALSWTGYPHEAHRDGGASFFLSLLRFHASYSHLRSLLSFPSSLFFLSSPSFLSLSSFLLLPLMSDDDSHSRVEIFGNIFVSFAHVLLHQLQTLKLLSLCATWCLSINY